MQDVSTNEGRTVLFVSHSMPTITSLCNKGILLEKGQIAKMGATSDVIMHYYNSGVASPTYANYRNMSKRPGDAFVKLIETSIKIGGKVSEPEIDIRQDFSIEIEFEILNNSNKLLFNAYFSCISSDGSIVFVSGSSDKNAVSQKGIYKFIAPIQGNFFNEGTYFLNIGVNSLTSGVQVHIEEINALSFNIKDPIYEVPTRQTGYNGIMPGVIRPLLNWTTEKTV
jgi:lipopolysaccharide transport system ATP-binding protein